MTAGPQTQPAPAANDVGGPGVAIVTGSTSGIGEAVVRHLAAEGWRVTVNGRGERAAELAAELVAAGHQAIGVAADVCDAGAVADMVAATVDAFGTVNGLVNNAGVPSKVPALNTHPDHWRRVLEINLTGPFLCAQAAGRVMVERGQGVIVNVSSIFGHVGLAERSAYCASKSGLRGLTQALAVEWAEHGVRVLSVDPAYVATPLLQQTVGASGTGLAAQEQRTPLGRVAEPAEIADVIAYALSPRAGYMTGSSIAVDGGWLAYGGW